MKLALTLSFLLLFTCAVALAQKIPADSTKATISQRVGLDDVTITYHRPNVRGRKIWGALVRYGMVWRTGADYPTFVTFADATTVEGKPLPAGKYALYTIPDEKSWTVIFSKNLGLWGAFGYKQQDDALRVEVKPESCEFTETFTIGFSDIADNRAAIVLQWESVKVPIRIAVDIDEKVLGYVREVIAGGKADWGTYWKGAKYLLKQNRELELAMIWIDKSIEMEQGWMNLWTKAQLLEARGDYEAALEYGKRAIEKGKEKENAPYFGYEITWTDDMKMWERAAMESSRLPQASEQKRQKQKHPSSEQVEEGYVTADDGARLFYRKVGSGPQSVIIPLGFMLFDDFKRLASGRTLIFYDMRNRGRSSAVADGKNITIQKDVEDLEKIRRHFNLAKVSLIGESYLGLMVVMYAMKYPQQVDRIVQIGAVPRKFGTEYPAHLTAQDKEPAIDPAEQEKLRKLEQEGHHKSNPKDYCEKEWLMIRAMLVARREDAHKVGPGYCDLPNEWPVNLARHFEHHFTSVQRLDIPKAEIAKVKHPVLTIHGTKDRNAPYGSGREWAVTLPDARLVTVEGAAHLPWIEVPELVFSSIDTFLRGQWPAKAEKITVTGMSGAPVLEAAVRSREERV